MTPSLSPISRVRAFSLIEMLVVLSILSVLAAFLFPAFLTVRGKARQTVCSSNLRQIGVALQMYQEDYDGYFPYAIDATDRVATEFRWKPYFPQFSEDIPQLPLLHMALRPYIGSSQIFRCPSDIGFTTTDKPAVSLLAAPTDYEAFGSSYDYYSMLSACHSNDAILQHPAQTNTLYDPVGYWHGTLTPLMPRYNILFADGHVKNLTRDQFDEMGHSFGEIPPDEFDATRVCSKL